MKPGVRILEVSHWRNGLAGRQVEQDFSSFFAKFEAYLIIFEIGACQSKALKKL